MVLSISHLCLVSLSLYIRGCVNECYAAVSHLCFVALSEPSDSVGVDPSAVVHHLRQQVVSRSLSSQTHLHGSTERGG